MGVRLSTTSILTSMLVGMVSSEIYEMTLPAYFPIYKTFQLSSMSIVSHL